MKIKKMFQGEIPENKILNTYSESQTDTYSCDYINNLVQGGNEQSGGVSYSTEEQIIGTWIDGKPLYRRVFTATTTEDMEVSATAIATLPLNTRVRKFDICLISETSGSLVPGNFRVSDTHFVYSQITASRTKMELKVSLSPYSTYGNRTINAILEYTKSDD